MHRASLRAGPLTMGPAGYQAERIGPEFRNRPGRPVHY
jgi:hypothetical protein